jgi:butyryl-CoA dehydrogenase
LSFDGAAGELVGEPNEGLKAMFAMMNTERIAVGIQGLAVAEASRQNAVAYARQRLQGRAATGVKAPELAADPIIVHADVRRMLMTQKALVEGSRMLALWAAQMLDVSERHADPAARRAAFDFVQLMTPVVKSFLTDVGSEAANLGVQILGGHGYIRGNGQEQFVRDVRVTQIYEGTNGIQAHDLLGRKVLQLDLIGSFTRPVKEFIAGVSQGDALDEFVAPLSEALGRLESVTMLLRQRGLRDPDEIGAAAVDYMRLFALTALGFLWAKAVAVSLPRGNDAFHRAKIATARFFIARVLPQAASLHTAIVTGAAPVMELDESMF